MSEADFALQWLDFLGNKVYNREQRIFLYDGDPNYKINPYGMLDTKIRCGQKLWDKEEEDQENFSGMGWKELDELGYAIKTEANEEFFWRLHQKLYYIIVKKRKDSLGLGYDAFRSAKRRGTLLIEQDPIKRRLRLKGDMVMASPDLPEYSGISDWVYYDEDKPKETITRKARRIGRNESRAFMKSKLYGESLQFHTGYQNIPEIPLLISEDKHIVCMRKEDTCQRMITTGESGGGKSVFNNGVAGRLFHQWQDRVGWLEDPLNQFYDLSLPQDFGEFNKINKWINNFPTPIPAVQLHLACKFKPKIIHDKISLLLTLNFEEFLKNYKFYTDGIDDYIIKGSTRYFTKTIEFVKNAKTEEEYNDAIINNLPELNTKNNTRMVYKWASTINTIFAEKFISNLYENEKHIAEELSIELKDGTKMSGHPFIMCMEAGLVPVLNISAARKQRWMRNYLADLMNKIVMHQIERGKQQKRMFIIADELNEIYEVGKPKDNAFVGFEELYRQGRFNNIGFVGNTQSLDKLNPEMYKNATHICCVYMKDADERKKIGKTFNLDKDVYNKIEELKPLEMMIFSKQPFVTYDRWGRRKVSSRKWFKGMIIPPINHHKIPPKGG